MAGGKRITNDVTSSPSSGHTRSLAGTLSNQKSTRSGNVINAFKNSNRIPVEAVVIVLNPSDAGISSDIEMQQTNDSVNSKPLKRIHSPTSPISEIQPSKRDCHHKNSNFNLKINTIHSNNNDFNTQLNSIIDSFSDIYDLDQIIMNLKKLPLIYSSTSKIALNSLQQNLAHNSQNSLSSDSSNSTDNPYLFFKKLKQ